MKLKKILILLMSLYVIYFLNTILKFWGTDLFRLFWGEMLSLYGDSYIRNTWIVFRSLFYLTHFMFFYKIYVRVVNLASKEDKEFKENRSKEDAILHKEKQVEDDQ